MREPKAIDIFLLLLLAVIWGSAFFNIKIATYTYDTFTLVFVRVFFAALALVLWCFYKKIKIMAFSKDWKPYALVVLVNISLPFLLIAYGTDKVQSYLSAILMSSTPLSGAILAHFFTHNEKINLTKVIGLIACLIGVFVIIIKGDIDLLINLRFTIGDLWMLAAAIGWALYSIYLFYWNSELKIFERFTLISFFGALSLLPFYIGEEIFYKQTVFMPEFYFWVIFAAISPGIIAFTLYTVAQKKLGASLTGFTLYVFTVYGAIYGYFLFDEKFENYHFIGTILVFFGIYLAKKKNAQKN